MDYADEYERNGAAVLGEATAEPNKPPFNRAQNELISDLFLQTAATPNIVSAPILQ